MGWASGVACASVLGGSQLGCASGGSPRWLRPGSRWQDASKSNPGALPRYRAEPRSLQDLREIVKAAEAEALTVRMTGSGHSYSDVAFSSGYLMSPVGLTRRLPVPREQLKAAARDAKLYRTESGATIRQLNADLDCEGLAFQNLGGYDAQTLAGAAMTGTHGSGLKYGPIPSQIVSLQVVVAGGEVLQLEPSEGITDAARFPGFVESDGQRVPARLVQDDRAFNAACVSMGALGVVYSVTLAVTDAFWLKEAPLVTTWGAVNEPGGFIDRLLRSAPLVASGPEPEYYEVSLNPYPPRRGAGAAEHQVLLQQRYKLEREPWRSTSDRKRGRLGAELDGLGTVLSGHGAVLAELVNRLPHEAPAVITESINSRADRSYIAKSYEVFNIGPVNHMRVFGVELSFHLRDTRRVAERFFQLAAEHADQGMVHTTPCTLRFVKRSPANLAMMHGRDTCTLEIGSVLGVSRAREMLLRYEQVFMRELGARPHWGLDMKALRGVSQLKALWGDANVDDWLAVYRELNRSGVFDGPLTDRLGISIRS